MYKVIWRDEAIADLAQLDRTMFQKIFDKVEKYLAKNPTQRGKPLAHQYKGLWSYRFSDYRVIYQVKETELLMVIVRAGHRREVY